MPLDPHQGAVNCAPTDPQTTAALKRLRGIHFALTRDQTPEQARRRERALTQLAAANEPELVAHVENFAISGPVGDIPLKMYTPHGSGPFPMLIYFHGGGGVIGDLDSDDGLCRRLTNAVECLVLSVGYHLAPEYKFPSGPEECYAASQWIAAHAAHYGGDPACIAIGGTSAGDNLAAVVAHMSRDRGGPSFVFQLLLVPFTDFRLPETPSLQAYAEGYLLTKEDIHWFTQHCLNSEEDKTNPLASPYLASSLAGLPPALIITAECDPLRDDGERYGKRLQDAGVPVTISRREGAVHGFLVPDQLHKVWDEAACALRAAFQ